MTERWDTLTKTIDDFVVERDWRQFHTPKNLAMALSVEASELLEHFQWLTPEASRDLAADKLEAVSDEMADVLVYLVRMAAELDVDLIDATTRKMARNAVKYPADKARGRSDKYTAYE